MLRHEKFRCEIMDRFMEGEILASAMGIIEFAK